MNEIKYKKIKEIREEIRKLSLNLGDLVNVLDNSTHNETFKDEVERNAWKVVEKINEISKQ